jgi:glycosyltransferase involved in cell wall biosynthesis
MKVVARVHLYPPDHCAGAELTLHTLLRVLVDRGHDCDVWLTYGPPTKRPYTLDGVRVHPRGTGGDHERVVRDAHVVLTHLAAADHTLTIANRFDIPVIQLAHNNFANTTRRDLRHRTSLVVYNSRWLAESLDAPWPSMVIPPPVLPDDYRTTPGDKITLINLMEEKGSKLFWRLARDMPDVEFCAVIGGYGRQVVRRDFPNVTVIDHSPDMRAVYSDTKILLMPSSYESWGRVGVEAMCSGIPVIAHSTPGLRESLGPAGIFLSRDEPHQWQAAIRRLLEDPVEYATASQAAAQRADELDPTASLDAFVDAVEALGQGRAAA